ncbi:MAG TPA: chorismate synthase [Thermoleophilia bacterium]|nr:chorismate synthase [Thermoleophilia bacterium]
MSRLRYLTAGESHGPGLTAVLDGVPAGLRVDVGTVDAELGRRQRGHGRGARQSIEQDRVRVLGWVRHGRTTGAPLALFIANRDAANWGDVLAVEPPEEGATAAEPVRVPRPGHADLGGALLYDLDDIRDVIERASARETAARVACGAVAKALLAELGCVVASHVVAIGGVTADSGMDREDVAAVEASPVRCRDGAAACRMVAAIDAAAAAGDTVGGVVEVIAFGYPPGAGSYVQGDLRLRSRLARAVLAVPAIVGVEFGLGFAAAAAPGSQVHDPIVHDDERGYGRESNRAGGIEGGISTGAPVVLRAAMKPISTLREPLGSVEMGTHRRVESRFERSDVCAVPAVGIVLEAVVALELADAALDRFGGATVGDLVAAVGAYRRRIGER